MFRTPCRVFVWAFLSRQNRAVYGYVLWRASLNLLYFSQPSLQSLPDSVSALARSGSRLSPSNIGYDLKAILAPSLAATCQQEKRVAFHCQFDVLHWQFLTAGIAQCSIEYIHFLSIIPDRSSFYDTRKYPLCRYILGVLMHTTACDLLWEGNEMLKWVSIYVAWLHVA